MNADSSRNAFLKARHFLENEKEFHLGALPTEQAHPITRNLSTLAQEDVPGAILEFSKVDDDLFPMLKAIFSGSEFRRLVDSLTSTLERGGKLYFIGCGATGRLSILLEAAWREFWVNLRNHIEPSIVDQVPDYGERVVSVMAGGDYAVIRSVEGYEDYQIFGKRQMEEAGLSGRDTVVATTEGGETSFVIGGAWKGVELGCDVFFVFNNPAEILRGNVARSREVIDCASITKLDLASGPMGIAGSTRLQAITSEFIVLAAALEEAIDRILGKAIPQRDWRAELDFSNISPLEGCRKLIQEIRTPGAVSAMGDLILTEEEVYRHKGLTTYWVDDFMLDILTDTTERAPTFSTPPFRKSDDTVSPPSWVFVKHRNLDTCSAWDHLFKRAPRGLKWTAATFEELGITGKLRKTPPKLDNHEILKFPIGNEADPSRWNAPKSLAVDIFVSTSVDAVEEAVAFPSRSEYEKSIKLLIGGSKLDETHEALIHVPMNLPSTPLRIYHHLAVKLVANMVSSIALTRLGRVRGNWMAHVECSNKKLIDRSIRLVATLSETSYEEACHALFETLEELEQYPPHERTSISPAMRTVLRLQERRSEEPALQGA
jgi:N-acetylmuramic acid 6-phosphate etherase